ncbi:hypothetical protein HAX54_006664, partial [Datura stramonium]|nr:hypothetical protein [Datura stramonium]
LLDYELVDPVIDNFGNTHFNFNVMPNSFTEHGAADSIYASEGVSVAPSSAFAIGENYNGDVSLDNFSFQDFINGVKNTVSPAKNRETIAPTGGLFQPSEPKLPAMDGQFDDDDVRNASSVCESQALTTAFPDPVPTVPDWSIITDDPVPTLPDFDHGGKELCTQNTLAAPVHDGADKMDTSGNGVETIVNSSSNLEDQTSNDILRNSPHDTDAYIDISDYLFNGNDDEELLFVGPDGNETIDVSSFLLDTPNESDMTDKGVPEISNAPDQQLPIPDGTCPQESSDNCVNHYTDQPLICNSDVQMLSPAVAVNPALPEMHGGAICMRNSQVLEVPNNDDVFLPVGMLSTSSELTAHQKYAQTSPPNSSVNGFSSSQKGSDEQSLSKKRKQNSHNNADIPLRMGLNLADYSVIKRHLDEREKTIKEMKAASDASKETAIAAQAALAVLHGRHSKYLIRKPQVLLGRATADVKVDIDLSREGRADKVSRRQVKDMTLMFEMNRSHIRHYIENLRTQCETHPTDIQGLQVLKNGVNPKSISPGSCLSSWNFSVDPCDYIFTDRFTCGFRCDLIVSGFYRVTEISLDQAGYAGLLPNSSSWNLPHLEVLDMSYNSLSGPIPNSLSNLTRLRRLSLSKNSFTGKIPSSVGSLLRLQELFLDNNKLTGSIPKSFNGLVNLKRLELQQNNISGELPDLNQLRNLIFLDLSDNSLAGNFFMTSFPNSIIELSLRNNYLYGEFPLNIGELRFLQVLDLSHNLLSGMIPSVLFHHSSLQQLTLSYNKFTFLQVPEDLGFRSKLIAIDLSYNNLHGFLPAFMASMPELSALNLEHNKFTGMIPTQYAVKVVVPRSHTASFERLLLGGNYLFGPIPGPLLSLKPGSVNVSLVDNCLYMCPDTLYICHGGNQKSLLDCKKFGPMIP